MAHPVLFTIGLWLFITIVFLGLADTAVATRENNGAPKRSKLAQIGTACMVSAFSLFVAVLIGVAI